jgi:thiamine biosynthesis lipoprotein
VAEHIFTFTAMATDCALVVHGPDEAQAAVAFAAALAEVERIETKYSRYLPGSVTSAINAVAAAGGSIVVDEETAALLDYAAACYARSSGLFDITSGLLRTCWDFASGRLPAPEAVTALLDRVGFDKLDWAPPRIAFPRAGMEIDLGGIGKEYAVDRVVGILRDLGCGNALVNLGGDIGVTGPREDGRAWPIALRHPRAEDASAAAALGCGALATSGDYARCIEISGVRYGHILDPRTGWPVHGLASVTVVADTCMVAGSLATIAMLKGEAGPEWLRSLGVPHLWVGADGRHGSTLTSVHEPGG